MLTKKDLLIKKAILEKARAKKRAAEHRDAVGVEGTRKINDDAVAAAVTTKRKRSTGNHGKGRKPAHREYMVVDQSEIKQECEISEQESDS